MKLILTVSKVEGVSDLLHGKDKNEKHTNEEFWKWRRMNQWVLTALHLKSCNIKLPVFWCPRNTTRVHLQSHVFPKSPPPNAFIGHANSNWKSLHSPLPPETTQLKPVPQKNSESCPFESLSNLTITKIPRNTTIINPPINTIPAHQTNKFNLTILVTKKYNKLMNSDSTNQFQPELKVESRQNAQK